MFPGCLQGARHCARGLHVSFSQPPWEAGIVGSLLPRRKQNPTAHQLDRAEM